MKLSKKYPILKRLQSLKKRPDRYIKEGLAVDIESEPKETKDAFIRGFDFTTELYDKWRFVKWYHVSKELFKDASQSYSKTIDLRLDDGVYILTGAMAFAGKDNIVIGVSDGGKFTVGFYTKGLLLPGIIVEAKWGDRLLNYWHTDGPSSPKEQKNNQAEALMHSIKPALLFAQHAGEEAKQMMTAPIPRKMNCIRPDRNDLGIKRHRLTASWYRDTVQGHPFMVRGHWRMQRHGEGLKKVKPKFIAPHMKNGYRSKPLRNAND